MNTYILFIFGSFNGHEEVEYFCTEVFPSNSFTSIKFIIENTNNIFIIFDSEKERDDLAKDLFELMTPDHVKFYFLFKRDDIVTAHVPQTMRDFMFKMSDENMMKVEFTVVTKKEDPSVVLDTILDKIDSDGMESLTPDEKNFLDNFEM
jgi:hypothetical protein